MKTYHNIEQGSSEWHALRLGRVTASKFKDVMAKARGKDKPFGSGLTAHTYMVNLAIEVVTGELTEFYSSKSMEHGTNTESEARLRYEIETDTKVVQVAFIERDDHVGVSPDGLIGLDGMVEIKCPNTNTQYKRYLEGDYLPPEYKPQVQGQLWVADREWSDFVSFDSRIEGEASYICTRVYRDDEYIKILENTVDNFVCKLKEVVDKLKG